MLFPRIRERHSLLDGKRSEKKKYRLTARGIEYPANAISLSQFPPTYAKDPEEVK